MIVSLPLLVICTAALASVVTAAISFGARRHEDRVTIPARSISEVWALDAQRAIRRPPTEED
jgi:hypothetical protein